ncbi:hypothetical protein GOEFS_083_00460, partial [Gordonia effusa NBRC 100432]
KDSSALPSQSTLVAFISWELVPLSFTQLPTAASSGLEIESESPTEMFALQPAIKTIAAPETSAAVTRFTTEREVIMTKVWHARMPAAPVLTEKQVGRSTISEAH